MSKQTDLINIPDAITVSGSNVGIGTSSPSATLHVSGQTRLESSGEAGPHAYRDGNSGNDIRFFSTNGTFASPTAKTPNSSVGQLHYSGHDGTTYRQNASIVVSVDGTVSTGTVPMRMTFHAGTTTNTERMRIDSSGRVTMPYQPGFLAHSTTGFNSSSTIMKNFVVIQHNTGGHFSNSTGLFTAPVAGKYLVNSGVLVGTGTGRLEFNVEVNSGSPYLAGNGTGTTYDGPTLSAVFNLSVNDNIRVRLVSGSPHSNGNHPNTYFGVTLLG